MEILGVLSGYREMHINSIFIIVDSYRVLIGHVCVEQTYAQVCLGSAGSLELEVGLLTIFQKKYHVTTPM